MRGLKPGVPARASSLSLSSILHPCIGGADGGYLYSRSDSLENFSHFSMKSNADSNPVGLGATGSWTILLHSEGLDFSIWLEVKTDSRFQGVLLAV